MEEKLLIQQRALEYWRALGLIRIYLRWFKIKSGHPWTRDFLDTLDLHSVEEMFGRIGKEERKRCCSLNAVGFQRHLQCYRKKVYSFTSKMEFQHIGFCVQVI